MPEAPEVKPEEKPLTPEQLWEQASKDRSPDPQQDAPIEAPAESGAPDILAGLPEPTRKLIEQIQAKTSEQEAALKEVGQKLARAHGTIGNLTAKLNDSMRTLTAMAPTVDAVAAREKAEAAAKALEKETKKQELRNQISDVLPGVTEYLDLVAPDVKPEAKPEPKPEEQQPQQPAESPEELKARLTRERELSDIHPKWLETVQSNDFRAWKKVQPADIQALMASDEVADAAEVLTMFKKHKEDAAKVAQVEAERQARLRRGETVQGSGSAQSGEAPSADALWEQAKRDRAKARAA